MSYITSAQSIGLSTLQKEDNKEECTILESVNEEKGSRWKEIKRKRYEEGMEYLKRFFSFPVVEGTIVKLDVCEDNTSVEDYKDKTGVYFLDENTLILGDEDNNIYLVFRKEEDEFVKHVAETIHVMGTYEYDIESVIHKRHEPARIPAHLRPLIVINNTINNFSTLKISEEENFFEKNYKRGGMCFLKDMKSHPEWMDEYKDRVQVKRVNICKSCRRKAKKGCCKYYSAENRVMLMMVIGWHK